MTSDGAQDFDQDNSQKQKKEFICGVVEGFYGRPWTTDQRKDLFRKLKRWGMDSYVYAPKDDYKHRAYWREMYTVEEAEHLTGLIAAAKEHGIVFYYALSPGLDMTYSNPKEVSTLKRKLDQVSQFGCDAFALLFDDIEPEMSKADKEVFQSFGQAQVSVTNEVHNHLNCSRFLFCPTQYCSTRAQPSVTNSEYLNTIGSKLVQEIDILWTGPKVISKDLTIESIQEVTEVMRRPPVIWDNLHANDYDPKRVFLGPYAGRSPELIPMLRGVLTNPNCEFHANQIAIHTLAHWSKCSSDTRINNSISADIKLETENEEGICSEDAPTCLSDHVYHPRVALKNAINDWLPEFYISKDAFGPITKPHPIQTMVMPVIPILPSINTCMSLTTTTNTVSSTSAIKVPEVNTTQLQALAEVCSTVTGAETMSMPNVVMNSLVSATKVITNDVIVNPIVATLNPITLPSIPLPIGSIGVPIMNLKNVNDLGIKLNDKSDNDLDLAESFETEDEKLSDTKKSDESMPVEDDTIIEMAHKIEENISETDVEVSEAPEPIEIACVIIKSDDSFEQPLNKSDDLNTTVDHLNSTEPMECASVNSMASPKHSMLINDVIMAESISTSSTGSMQVESSDTSLTSNTDMHDIVEKSFDRDITVDDLYLLCDLFYLPFEHGSRSLQVINEFYWLKTNAIVLVTSYKKGQDISSAKPEVQEWFQRADKFYNLCQSVIGLAKKIASCANKELCYDLYSYVWDMAGVITLLCAFIKWLSLGFFPANINSYTQGNYTWFSKGWRETFSSGDQEPWVFRGGLTADLQRLIPIDSGNDLFIYKLPDAPTTNFYAIRPYSHMDEAQIYDICHKTCRDGSDCTELFSENLQSIPADRLIGPFVTINPEFCLVLHNSDNHLAGYACASLNAKQFYQNQEMCWFPEMRLKYPLTLLDSSDLTPAAKDSINHFHNFKYDYPQEVLNTHPSIMVCSVLKEQCNADSSLAKRLVTVLLAALRSNGSFGVHVCINTTDRFMHQFYSKLGFTEIFEDTSNGRVYLGRNF